MKNKCLLLAVVVLSGCASINEMRAEPPYYTAVSEKNAKDTAECILFGWQNNSFRYGDVYIQPYNNGYTVYSSSSLEVADVVPKNNMTEIKFYHQGGLFKPRINDRINYINSCSK